MTDTDPLTYAGELAHVTAALTRLAVRGSSDLTSAELDVALTGRAAVLDLLATVHRELSGIAPRTAGTAISDLAGHPVGALAGTLRDHSRPALTASPTDVLAVEATSPAGQAWRDVARHAMLAGHAWTTGTGPTPDGETAWVGIADVAAVAGVLAELDHDLAQAAAALHGRADDAAALRRAATSGLSLAARETTALAASAPLAQCGPDRANAPNRVVIRATDAKGVIAAQHQLAALLRTAQQLRPERLQLIALSHYRTCRAIGAVLDAPGQDPPRLAAALAAHTALLEDAVTRRATVASLDGGDPLPIRQAAALRQGTTDARLLASFGLDPALGRGIVAALADTTRALSETADRHLAGGRWLLPSNGLEHRAGWVPSTSWHDVRKPYQSLRAAAANAEHLAAYVAQPQTAAPAPAGPRHALAPAPLRALRGDRRPARPATPGIPLTARAPAPRPRPHRR